MNEFMRQLLFLPEQASTLAVRIDRLHYFVISVTMVASFLVGTTALAFFVIYRRRKPGQRTEQVHGPLWMELSFFFIPLTIFLVWFGIGFRDFVFFQTPPKNSMDVYVMGKQWMWKFAYPGGPNSVGTLRVPVGRPVRLLMTSRDVIHSFYVPAFRIKMDVVPGRYSQTWFEATKVGRFQVLCTEYCGTSHSQMWAEVDVMAQEDFDRWMQEQRGLKERLDGSPEVADADFPMASLVAQGEKVAVQQGCLKCHSVDGSPHIGTTWLDLYERKVKLSTGEVISADEGYLTESMMDPAAKLVEGFQPVMPTYRGRLAGPDAAALVEYIKSLRSERLENASNSGAVYEPVPAR